MNFPNEECVSLEESVSVKRVVAGFGGGFAVKGCLTRFAETPAEPVAPSEDQPTHRCVRMVWR